MKRFLIMIMALFALVALSACGKKEYPYDGEFMAFAHGENLEVTMVTVTIKKGKITGYYIDSIQSTRKEIIKEEITTYESKWNEKSKKELGYYYGMHAPQAGTMPVTADNLETYKAYLEEENKLEWFEQAELIEKAWLKDGVDSVTYGKNNVIDNVSGVTVRGDTYVKLAKEAVANAKLGKYQAVVVSGSDLYSAYMLVDKKKIKELVIDTRQEASKETDEDFAWKEKTKQQLGYYYGMHAPQAGTMPVTAENLETYKAYLEEENKLEWFEQVAIITDDVIKNGKDSKVDKTAGVTIITDNYYQLIAKLFAYKK
ncbi:MAG: hypothetical protein M0P92_03010 [Acholeplasmataceae bacterium]|nr:hypothetical protein [Acholeplasmataceae bacterium]